MNSYKANQMFSDLDGNVFRFVCLARGNGQGLEDLYILQNYSASFFDTGAGFVYVTEDELAEDFVQLKDLYFQR